MTPPRTVELLSSLPGTGPICRTSWDGWYDVVHAARHRLILSSYSFGHHGTADEPEHPLFARLADVMHRLPGLQVDLLLSMAPLARSHERVTTADLERRLGAVLTALWTPGVRKPNVYCAKSEWERDQNGYASGVNHAKFAVADGRVALITSANLTQQATTNNLEVGVVLHDPGVAMHLTALVDGWIAQGVLRRTLY